MPPDDAKRRTTGIEWTEHTWNPMVGCSLASPGCTNCYAMRQAHRLEHAFGQRAYRGTTTLAKGTPVWTGKLSRASASGLRKPASIREPSTIFVNSMSDLFHPDAPDLWRDEAFSVMRAVPRHRYQVLTKRPEVAARFYAGRPELHGLPHVWLGVSVEDAPRKARIDVLRTIPAAVRFLSVEPLIGPLGPLDLSGIHWVITGGESGPGARPCHPDWVRGVLEACRAQDVPLFHKQWGTYANNPLVLEHGMVPALAAQEDPNGKGGALLDGRLWREMPA